MHIEVYLRSNIFKQEIKLFSTWQRLKILTSFDFHHFEEILTKIPILLRYGRTMLITFGWNLSLEASDFSAFLLKLHVHFSNAGDAVCFLKQQFQVWLSSDSSIVLLIWNNGVNFVICIDCLVIVFKLVCGCKFKDGIVLKFVLE